MRIMDGRLLPGNERKGGEKWRVEWRAADEVKARGESRSKMAFNRIIFFRHCIVIQCSFKQLNQSELLRISTLPSQTLISDWSLRVRKKVSRRKTDLFGCGCHGNGGAGNSASTELADTSISAPRRCIS